MYLRRCIVLLAAIFCSAPVALPSLIKSITADFVREVDAGGTKERAQGHIYYEADSGMGGKIIIRTVEPFNQWMIFEGNDLCIYYPQSSRAFKINSDNPIILPFFQFILDSNKEDFGLSFRGFQFARYEKDNESLISYWAPSKDIALIIGEVVLTHRHDCLYRVLIKDSKGALSSEIVYEQYISSPVARVPSQIKITTYEKDSISQEVIFLRNLQVNGDIPASIIDFQVPLGTEVKSVGW